MVKEYLSVNFLGLLCWATVVGSPASVWCHADLEAQIAAITERISLEPDHAELYLKRGELYREHCDWQKAEADYDHAAKCDPQLAVVDLARGNLLFDRDLPQAARVSLDRFLKRFPLDVRGLVLRARTFVKLGQPKAAVEDYTRAIENAATPAPEFFIERAQALSAEGSDHIDEALRGIEEGRKKLGTVITLELCGLDLELQKGDFDAALARLDRIASTSPRKETWLARRGDILEKAKRPAEARKAYADSLEAIDLLPKRFRHTKAVEDLETRVRASLQRLSLEEPGERAVHAP